MAALVTEHVTDITHWNDRLFSFRTTRRDAFRFRNGHFVMLGVEVDGKPLLRAYSIASANHDEHLEFFSIKVQDGPLTSRLQHLQINDPVWVSKKPVGTLVTDDLNPGKRLILLSTGTGLAPFLALPVTPKYMSALTRSYSYTVCVRKTISPTTTISLKTCLMTSTWVN